MTPDDLNRVLDALRGSNFERQVKGLEEFLAYPRASISEADRQAVIREGVNLLETALNPIIIMERLEWFGSDAMPSLFELLNRESAARDARVIAAEMLLRLGSRLGVKILLEEVSREGSFCLSASRVLSDAGISDHALYLVDQLRRSLAPTGSRVPSNDDDRAIEILASLIKTRVSVPEDISNRFFGAQAPTFFRAICELKCGRPLDV